MKKHQSIFLAVTFMLFNCSYDDNIEVEINSEDTFYSGMGLSFQSEFEDYNIDYKNETGISVELLDFVKSKSTNLVRLKLWHTPQDGENGLEDVKNYAQKIRSRNMDFLLNIHYSDYWADPGTQTPPLAWQNLPFNSVKDSVYIYTKKVVSELKAQNTMPEIIQVGNETDSGFLWNYGRVWDNFDDNWPNYAALVAEAIKAIRDVDTENNTKIMLHHASVENAIYFFNELALFNLDFDIIGLSYYPQFQIKDLEVVAQKFNELASSFNKDIMVLEVAYPLNLQWNDNQTNYIGSLDQTIPEFSSTPQGQKAFIIWLKFTIKNIPDNKGIGFCYWAPDWVAFNCNQATSTNGSSWENQCLFDFDLNALPALDVFSSNN